MQTAEIKHKLEEMIDGLVESKLELVYDFVSYLQEKRCWEEFMKMQINSKSYQGWLGPENDIYDEVFKDAN